jgi:RimJ/RimL family protein N-acetyltransferase
MIADESSDERAAARPYSIRPLRPDEWAALREIRLAALLTEPGMFFSAYAQEALLDEDAWRAWIGNPAQCVFGLFHRDELVGITAVYTHRDDPSGRTALFGSTYIDPAHRGRGLTRLLYAARLDWVRIRPRFGRIVVSHRRSNVASMRAMRLVGFVETGTQVRAWPDGTTEDEVLYELDLTHDGRMLDPRR